MLWTRCRDAPDTMRVVSEAYEDRPIDFLEVRRVLEWRLKTYAITYGSEVLDSDVYDRGTDLASRELPQPAVNEGRGGVGFVICHQGRGIHFLVLNWWDRENELFNRVFTRGFGAIDEWQPAARGETACVWDLQGIAHEREAFVNHVLSRPSAPDFEAYLADARE